MRQGTVPCLINGGDLLYQIIHAHQLTKRIVLIPILHSSVSVGYACNIAVGIVGVKNFSPRHRKINIRCLFDCLILRQGTVTCLIRVATKCPELSTLFPRCGSSEIVGRIAVGTIIISYQPLFVNKKLRTWRNSEEFFQVRRKQN